LLVKPIDSPKEFFCGIRVASDVGVILGFMARQAIEKITIIGRMQITYLREE
jgi:hypothetical protein